MKAIFLSHLMVLVLWCILGGCCGCVLWLYWVVVVACVLWCILGGGCGLCFVVYIGWLMWPAFWWTLAVLDMLNTKNNRYLSTNNLYTPDKFKEIIRHVPSAISRQKLKTVFNNMILSRQKWEFKEVFSNSCSNMVKIKFSCPLHTEGGEV